MTTHPNGETPTDTSACGTGPAAEFVTFLVGDEAFAAPLSRVREIIRVPALVQLPLAPPSMEGITNLRGVVLPVLNLRRVFGMAEAARDEATRVLVLDIGRPVGVVVDRVLAVQSVDPSRIDGKGRLGPHVDGDLVVEVIRPEAEGGGGVITMVLDVEGIVARATAMPEEGTRRRNARENRIASAEAAESGRAHDDVRQFVSFVVEGQEYALPIADVQEIVHVPRSISAVPNAPPALIGMVTLRERLLPLLSLRSLLGLPLRPIGPEDRVVVVSPASGGHSTTFGILTDAVREVLRIGVGVIDPMPRMVGAGDGLAEIAAVCRLEGGRRLVSVLDPERVFRLPEMAAANPGGADVRDSKEKDITSGNASRASGDEEQVVVFKLGDEEFGVAIDNVQEIVRLPERLIRVPNAPDFIEGIMNLRGTIVPLVDQRRRFRLPPMERNERQRVVVFTLRGVRSGFIVDSVIEVRRIARSEILPAPETSDDQRRLIRRVANLPDRKRIIQILDIGELLDTNETDAAQAAAA